MPSRPTETSQIDERTIECIIDRLALCESPKSIASSYAFPLALVRRIRDENQGKIWKMRRNWRDYIEELEPLASHANRILFLGAIARLAMRAERYGDSIRALHEIKDVLTEQSSESSAIMDLEIMDRIHRGDMERAMEMLETEEAVRRENPLKYDRLRPAIGQDLSQTDLSLILPKTTGSRKKRYEATMKEAPKEDPPVDEQARDADAATIDERGQGLEGAFSYLPDDPGEVN